MFKEKLTKLTKQLYPTGRAFNIKDGSVISRLHKALIESENTLVEDAISILDTILPDNDNFTTDDATRWEERLGLITNPAVSLADRKLAIERKMNHPGDILARQSHDYLEDRLQAAGFNLFVHENPLELTIEQALSLNPGVTQWGQNQFGNFQFSNVTTFFPNLFGPNQWGNNNFGGFQWGEFRFTQVVANHIDSIRDIPFQIGDNVRSTFFIGASVLGELEDIDVNRREELRQLILRIKPVQSVAYLLINYV